METVAERKAAVARIRQELENSRETHIWQDYVNALRLVSQVVFTRSAGFVLEFIQNAEDSGQGLTSTGEVTVSLNKERLKFVHNGRPFDDANLKAICGIRSSKKPERGTLGYLGIGFKSAFKVADCAEVYSNGFRFKFDRNHEEWASHSTDTPWHVIPIWLESPSEALEEDKTTFVIRLRDAEAYENLAQGLKAIRVELYLFLKWIKKITIRDEVSGAEWNIEDLGSTPDGITTLKHGTALQKFKFFRREVEVPVSVKTDRLTQEYRANVVKREIAIAFAVDQNDNLDPSPSRAMYGGVYSFLPLGESKSGAKFPIQADFLVQPGRDSANAEALWNHWLLGEIASLCKFAITELQQHQVWKYQYLAAFEFIKSPGFEAYERLFGPKLIEPIERHLNETACVLTVDERWAKLSNVVALNESPDASKGLFDLGVLSQNEIASAFGGEVDLQLVHPRVARAVPNRFKQVDRWSFFDNDSFFKAKAQSNDASWFRSLYRWLSKFPVFENSRRRPVRGYHGQEIVFVASQKTLKGGGVHLLELPEKDQFIENLAYELQKSKDMLHPDILAGAADEKDRDTLKGFLLGLVGVQKMDAKTVCEQAILPKIVTIAPQPAASDLLKYTKYCVKYLTPALLRPNELWVIAKLGGVRAAREVLFSTEYKPPQNWEFNQVYVPGLDFLAAAYVSSGTQDHELKAWRDFFRVGGVKEAPDNGVELFAMNYAIQHLASTFASIIDVHGLNSGYDLEGVDKSSLKAHIEIKGQSAEGDVELTENEAKAANKYRQQYYLCVVPSIPETPAIHLVPDPASVGQHDKLTVRLDDWKSGRLDSPSNDGAKMSVQGELE